MGVIRIEQPGDTRVFSAGKTQRQTALQVLGAVYDALCERGYDPVSQLAGYLLSGDPAYITAHHGARSLVHGIDRADLLAELIRTYLQRNPYQ